MRGVEIAEVRSAILRAFKQPDFDIFLSDRFDFDRAAEVGDGPFKVVVQNVIEQFENEGRAAHLIAEIAAVRPLKADVQAVYRKYAQRLISESWKRRLEARQLEALDRYGLLPPVDLQLAGKVAQTPPLSLSDAGFQKKVNETLPELDAYVWSMQLLMQTRRVCLVEVDDIPLGTGFLAGPETVLTNHHVVAELIDKRAAGTRLKFLFDYMKRLDGMESEGVRVGAASAWEDWHVDSSPELPSPAEDKGIPEPTEENLDYALVRLERRFGDDPIFGASGGPRRGWIRVPSTAPALTPKMALAILQHPKGKPVKFTFDTQSVLSVNESRTRVRYATNTDDGSSGSPCFNVSWGLVALHHFGDPHNRPPAYNQGIPITAVQARLAKRGKASLLGGDPP
ncbi:trypsin-like peptidase domain-containing protein [Sorangium sp. So ce385]|uniref:trypsin-like peptidase domain-containing protein n=1 Tax=Sorangium sp. So ce385 TaxID=3133308 RepID=UPI003F5C3FF5